VILTALALSMACTTSQTTVPPVSGPSELALSLRLVAVPDSINQDGSSKATVEVTAFDANGKTCSGLPVHMDTAVGGAIEDFGTLSARDVVTGSNGKAQTVYTAPPPPSSAAANSGSTVMIVATPSSSVGCGSNQSVGNFNPANRQQVAIRLVPVGLIPPPADTPTAKFTSSSPATVNVQMTFDASTSCPGPVDASGVCQPPVQNAGATSIVSYVWNFGDGGAASGRIVSHSYATVGKFTVTLTVTNDRGRSASATADVTTDVTAPATGDFVISPDPPLVNGQEIFNASSVKAAPGHNLVQYNWDFGDGGTGTGVVATHTYLIAAKYTVVLSVLDETGQRTTITKPVTVGTGNPTAVLSLIKTGGTSIQADGGASLATGTSIIATYTFIWGDGSQDVSATPVLTHTYAPPVFPATSSTFTVTLRVTDNATPARSSTASQPITVP
jgi:PKD repeat protein